ncbi:MAG: type IV pilus biogenesis/stability protein PilW [Dokdonella sp.]|uniref:type IV pilus biogenesis/stability protein PilW n=1 Tax=Dokdonella sp. TaxID=2291710 RepID=UPI0025C22C6E|nr:type IV pilus biogenesis/stability protein PilW [Dokdonella sp.]MBZ0221603.1 type IV pilus biogenesis/stability protein PilW [Dokdonella sp.]MCC7256619.1 type IV pilus biogenesis/stability protein PilW [Dokdonella sp.]
MSLDRLLLGSCIALAALALGGCGSPGSSPVRKESAKTQQSEAARIHTELGQKYLQQGKAEVALEKLQKALQFDPNYVDAHTVIAVLYESINDLPKAEEHYRRAVELKPKGGAENNNYGRFLCERGRYDEAQGYFTKALADPFYQTPALAMSNAGTCLARAGKTDAAEKMLREALALNGRDASALLAMGSVLYAKGDYFNARGFLQRYESIGAPQAAALMLGRNIELQLKNAAGASEYSRKLLRDFPKSTEAQSLGGKD